LLRYGHNLRVRGRMSIRPLLVGIAMTGMFGRGAPATEQTPAPQSARTPGLEELGTKRRLTIRLLAVVPHIGSP
jgi:hypothetical protein